MTPTDDGATSHLKMKGKMMSNMKGIIIYMSYFDDFEDLTDEQVGKFIKGLKSFVEGEKVIFDDLKLEGYWLGKKRDFEIMLNNYNTKVDTNRENGKKGGRPSKTQSVKQEPNITQETHSVIQEPTETQPNPQNLKESDKDIVISLSNDKDACFKHLGGYGKFLETFPLTKVRNQDEGKVIWDSYSQDEKQQIFRHLKMYVKDMTDKLQVNYMKNSFAYLESELWKNMKPQVMGKKINRGMVNYTFVSFLSKKRNKPFDEIEKLIYIYSTDKEFNELLKEYKEHTNKILNN